MNAMQLQQLENPSVSTRMRVAAETTHSGALLRGARPAHGAIIRRLAGMKPVERGKKLSRLHLCRLKTSAELHAACYLALQDVNITQH